MHGGNRPDPACSGGTCVHGGSNRSNLSSHDRCDKTGVDLFVSDQSDIGRLDHCVGRFDHSDQAHTFNHPQCFHIYNDLSMPGKNYFK
jgi:hypothetical protein